MPPLLPEDRAAEEAFVAELRAWQETYRQGDPEADVEGAGVLARERLCTRLQRWLKDGNIDRARALAIAAGLPGDAERADLDAAARLIQAGSDGGWHRDSLDRDLLQITRADLMRAGRFRAVGAWGEYSGVQDFIGGRPWHSSPVMRWRRAAWAVAAEPAVLATIGDGAIAWPHRMLPLPRHGAAECAAALSDSPAWCGWNLAVGPADPRTDMAAVRILGTLAGRVEGTRRAVSAALDEGAVPWKGGVAQTAELALEMLMDERLAHVDPMDVPVCLPGQCYVEEMPPVVPDVDLLQALDRCTHPHPTWELNPARDALRLACSACAATALAVVPLHLAPGQAIADGDAYLQRERFYAILEGRTPPASMAEVRRGARRATLDVDEVLGRRNTSGDDLATALFG